MEDHPEISLRNVQNLTDFPRGQPLDLPEGEGVCLGRGKLRKALGELIEEFLLSEKVGRIGAPIGRPGCPVSARVEWWFSGLVRGVSVRKGFLPGLPTEMVGDLVLEDPDKPGGLGGAAGKRFPVFQRRKEGLLDEVLRHRSVPQSEQRVPEQVVPVTVHPVGGIAALWLSHESIYRTFSGRKTTGGGDPREKTPEDL